MYTLSRDSKLEAYEAPVQVLIGSGGKRLVPDYSNWDWHIFVRDFFIRTSNLF